MAYSKKREADDDFSTNSPLQSRYVNQKLNAFNQSWKVDSSPRLKHYRCLWEVRIFVIWRHNLRTEAGAVTSGRHVKFETIIHIVILAVEKA